jgi:hypothetical protein
MIPSLKMAKSVGSSTYINQNHTSFFFLLGQHCICRGLKALTLNLTILFQNFGIITHIPDRGGDNNFT